MSWRGRLGRLDWLSGPNDESDEMNLMKNMLLSHIACRVSLKMAWRGRWSDEKYSTGSQCLLCRFENDLERKDWQAWPVGWTRWWVWCGPKMAWRDRLGRLDQSGGPDGDRAVRADRQLRAGSQNRSATNGSWWAAGGEKRWLTPITLVLKGRGVFVLEQHINTNRLHTNPNYNVVQDSINNTYDTIVLWLHKNPNCNVVQDSINVTYDTNVL